MNTSLSTNKVRPNQQVGGGFGFFDEIGFEMETPSLVSMAKGLGGIVGDIFSIGSDLTEGESSESNTDSSKLSIGGQTEIDFKKRQTEAEAKLKQRDEADRKKAFNQAMEQNRLRAQQAKDKMLIEEEINDISVNLSTEEKNKLLHYQASYKANSSIYQRAELRRKIIEERKKAEKQEKASSIPSPAKQASALQTAFEGGSGSQGGGQANLSAHATG